MCCSFLKYVGRKLSHVCRVALRLQWEPCGDVIHWLDRQARLGSTNQLWSGGGLIALAVSPRFDLAFTSPQGHFYAFQSHRIVTSSAALPVLPATSWAGMATIKAIEAKSVHQIQSGQVIVDLCSVAKELIENSLDAGATSIEVRFKNNGLDAIEVQDNGSGISPENYENVALKHFTSKLSSYDDLSSLTTFGFRGEALSSLCALSKFSIVTARAEEAPKGKRLDFDTLGKLKSTTIVAAQKGTTATVENLFEGLPVRRKELQKNIKREYGKVLGLLHAYACIGVNVKFTVKSAMPKSKSLTVFSTKGNATTRENIANVYGAKTLSALAPLDLVLEYQTTLTQLTRKEKHTSIHVKGHISKPVFGEGRQTPDRQMFFVNGRPCGLPQIAKAINEVYKAFNVAQSPFIFADLQMDTDAYDVNVSPDKRTILIQDAASLVENLKTSLNDMFDQQEQTVPQSQLKTAKLPALQKLNLARQSSSASPDIVSQHTSPSETTGQANDSEIEDEDVQRSEQTNAKKSLFQDHFQNFTSTREEPEISETKQAKMQRAQEKRAEKIARIVAEQEKNGRDVDEYDDVRETMPSTQSKIGEEDEGEEAEEPSQYDPIKIHARDFNARMAEAALKSRDESIAKLANASTMPSVASEEKGVVLNAFDRMRPKRLRGEVATVTVGDKTFTTILGSPSSHSAENRGSAASVTDVRETQTRTKSPATLQFSQQLKKFGAQGSDNADEDQAESEDEKFGGFSHDADSDETKNEPGPEFESNATSDEEEVDENYTLPRPTENDSDDDFIDDEEKKKAEEAKVAELIQAAEAKAAVPTKENLKRATKALTGGRTKDSTTDVMATVNFSTASIKSQMRMNGVGDMKTTASDSRAIEAEAEVTQDPETRLSLTVSKPDFEKMRIVGQFNLGFIVAVRPGNSEPDQSRPDELFIIDQHASDEKYNFERLQAETVVGNQRLVRPVVLDLTAVEEEIVLENNDALERNGFLVEIDTSGESMVGQRCRLVSLPLSKEVVFGVRDLEELIQLLTDSPSFGESGVPRPSKVRKMFAMRACRSSIMIGKTLSMRQMKTVVSHMGTIDKPWNCPHGRPTMRHLCSLDALQPWREEVGVGVGGQGEGEGDISLGEALHRYVEEEE